jgi:hypothetical protein
VEVVKDQGHGGLLGQRVDEARQKELDDGWPRGRQHLAGFADTGTHAAECLEQIGPQHRRVVVVFVKAEPGHRPPRGLGLIPGGEQAGLAESRRTGHEGQAEPGPGTQTLLQVIPAN